MLIDLEKLIDHYKNTNVMNEEMFTKLVSGIVRTGNYPPIIVRPLEGSDEYQILDGHWRKKALLAQGKEQAECDVWRISEIEGDILVATLNTIHGDQDAIKREALIRSLSSRFKTDDLAKLLPESRALIAKIIGAQQQKIVETTVTVIEKTKRVSFALFPGQRDVVEQALAKMRAQLDPETKNPEAMALEMICADYLSGAPLG